MNHSSNQKLVSIPKESDIQEGDYVLINKLELGEGKKKTILISE